MPSGFKITNKDPQGRYVIEKQIIGDPHLNCLLVHTKFTVAPQWEGLLHLYVICAPHLNIGGWHNNGEAVEKKGRRFLTAYRDNVHMVLAASCGFVKLSCGYVGASDGWTDLAHNFKMDWRVRHGHRREHRPYRRNRSVSRARIHAGRGLWPDIARRQARRFFSRSVFPLTRM